MSSHYETCDICDQFHCDGHSVEEWVEFREKEAAAEKERRSWDPVPRRDLVALEARITKLEKIVERLLGGVHD